MAMTKYQVTGMSCGHCEAAVRDELRGIAGIDSAEVSAATGRLSVGAVGPIDDAAVIAAVDEAGYTAVRVP